MKFSDFNPELQKDWFVKQFYRIMTIAVWTLFVLSSVFSGIAILFGIIELFSGNFVEALVLFIVPFINLTVIYLCFEFGLIDDKIL